jgi:1-deoxy-D-xylulose-5-phosphate reductoisomerase
MSHFSEPVSIALPLDHQVLTILGSTGSIGQSTLEVVATYPDSFSVFALTANSNVDTLFQQCQQFQPRYAVTGTASGAIRLQERLAGTRCRTEVLYGVEQFEAVAAHEQVDTVMAAIVGAAGLLPTMAAVRAGKKVLLANKESLVMAGQLFMDAVTASGAQLLPIDSEHNAIFQCLPHHQSAIARPEMEGVRKILLTCSGGPFRQWQQEKIWAATPEQACRHPNWSMGRKISVDSASLMNKGLEFIEAKWLFDVDPNMIEVVIHPQSIIHSMVEYIDGSVLAQLGNPDMRTPIAYGLAYPHRIESGVSSLDIIAAAPLDFEVPDVARFPALKLAITAATDGIGAATTLNAVNEVAVSAFLNHRISFGAMVETLDTVMNVADWSTPSTLESIIALDNEMRCLAAQTVEAIS